MSLFISKSNDTTLSSLSDYDFKLPSLSRLAVIMEKNIPKPITVIASGFRNELKITFLRAGSSLVSSAALKTSILFLWVLRNLKFAIILSLKGFLRFSSSSCLSVSRSLMLGVKVLRVETNLETLLEPAPDAPGPGVSGDFIGLVRSK